MNVRPATRGDFAAVAELFAAADEAATGRPSWIGPDAVEGWLQTSSLETNTWLVEEDEQLVAAAFAQLHGLRGNSAGAVRPSARGLGLGAQLVDRIESRLGAEGAERIQAWALAADERAAELFSERGYREARRFWEMAVELDGEPPKPRVSIEQFHEEDAPAFHDALEEAFADHWEHQPEALAAWWGRQRARTTYDPSLWFVVRDEEEIVAVVRNELRSSGGYVGALGVRRAWRGRGYGRALLLHSFGEFRKRGMTRASLGVDAANATGATQLYESVGMYVEQENVVWEKLLR